MRRLRAVFRSRVEEDPEAARSTLRLLIRALRIIRLKDPDAELRVLPDHPEPPAHDQDGD